jgi:hypothetical protein
MSLFKKKTPRSPKYLEWLRSQPCCVCGTVKNEWMDVVPAHQSFEGRGVGIKANDFHCIPLCVECHDIEHMQGVESFWVGEDRKMIVIAMLSRYIEAMK